MQAETNGNRDFYYEMKLLNLQKELSVNNQFQRQLFCVQGWTLVEVDLEHFSIFQFPIEGVLLKLKFVRKLSDKREKSDHNQKLSFQCCAKTPARGEIKLAITINLSSK